MIRHLAISALLLLLAVINGSTAQDRFKLRNGELGSFRVDVAQPEAAGRTLASRRHSEGVTFTADPGSGTLRTSNGLCVVTGSGDNLELGACDQTAEQWRYYQMGDFSGLVSGAGPDFMACWYAGTGAHWQEPYDHDGGPLHKEPMDWSKVEMGCLWWKQQA